MMLEWSVVGERVVRRRTDEWNKFYPIRLSVINLSLHLHHFVLAGREDQPIINQTQNPNHDERWHRIS
jgi:hypothetical protein